MTFANKHSKIKNIFDTFGLIFLALTVAIGVIAVIIDGRHRKRQFTMQVVQEFGSPEMFSARALLRSRVLSIQSIDPNIENPLVGRLLSMELASEASNEGRESVVRIVDFFNRVSLCIGSNLCSPKVACDLIGNEGASLYSLLGPSIEEIAFSRSGRGWASGLEELYAPDAICADDLSQP